MLKRVLVIALLLLLAWPMLVLLAAHWQIRSVAPPLPGMGDIAAVLAAGDGPVHASFIVTASQRSDAGTLGHPGVFLQWADGRRFLIDTGMPPKEAVAFGRLIELLMGADPTQTFGGIADQIGERVNAIAGIAFTHLHSDHTDGLPQICERQHNPATVFQAPLQYQQRNYTTDMGFEALERARCPRRLLDDATVMPVPGFPGLAAISLGGHTPGSTLFAALIDGHYWLFSGDITNDKHSLVNDVPKHWSYSLLVVPEDTERTALLRRWLADLDQLADVTVLPAHDIAVMAEALSPEQVTQ